MAREHKLSPTDNYLAVLYQQIQLAEEIYDSLRSGENTANHLIDHKNSINWLLRDLQIAIDNNQHWSRGRILVQDLREIRVELFAYSGTLFNRNPRMNVMRIFQDRHQVFYGIIVQLRRLFRE